MGLGRKEVSCIDSLPDKVLLRIFSFLKHSEMMKFSVVSKKWRMIAQDSRLWSMVSLRPEISGDKGRCRIKKEKQMMEFLSLRF